MGVTQVGLLCGGALEVEKWVGASRPQSFRFPRSADLQLMEVLGEQTTFPKLALPGEGWKFTSVSFCAVPSLGCVSLVGYLGGWRMYVIGMPFFSITADLPQT